MIIKFGSIGWDETLKNQRGRDYSRLTFWTDDMKKIKVSMSLKQKEELFKSIGAQYNDPDDYNPEFNPFSINIDETLKTRKNKPIIEHRVGSFKGNDYDYYELSSFAFISAGLITPFKNQLFLEQ